MKELQIRNTTRIFGGVKRRPLNLRTLPRLLVDETKVGGIKNEGS